jgi:hypothetical protein
MLLGQPEDLIEGKRLQDTLLIFGQWWSFEPLI